MSEAQNDALGICARTINATSPTINATSATIIEEIFVVLMRFNFNITYWNFNISLIAILMYHLLEINANIIPIIIIIIIIIIKKCRHRKAGRERFTPYPSEDPSPTIPTSRKKREMEEQ